MRRALASEFHWQLHQRGRRTRAAFDLADEIRHSLLSLAAAGDWAVITGASTGSGRQLALEAAREGYNVVLTARRAPLPRRLQVRALLAINLKTLTLEEGVNLDALAEKMEGYSGADITNLCRDAAMMTTRQSSIAHE